MLSGSVCVRLTVADATCSIILIFITCERPRTRIKFPKSNQIRDGVEENPAAAAARRFSSMCEVLYYSL